MNLTTNISIPTGEIHKLEQGVRSAVLDQLKRKLHSMLPTLEQSLRGEIRRRLQQSDVIEALLKGNLRAQLGLTHEEVVSMSTAIPDAVGKALHLRIHKTASSLDIVAEMISRGYEELLSIPQATYVQTHTTGEPREIKWLEWLLTKGDTIVVGGFRVKYTPNNTNSRSQGAIMLKGSGFRISPQWAGTAESNFITRALDGINDYLYKEVIRYL
jgi:hypothetical protein